MMNQSTNTVNRNSPLQPLRRRVALRTPPVIVLVTMLLIGCSRNVSDQSKQQSAIAATTAASMSAPFNATIEGVIDEVFSARARLFCSRSAGGGEEFELYAHSRGQFNLRMPRTTTIGNHPVIGSRDSHSLRPEQVTVYFQSADNQRFDQQAEGAITFTALPADRGQPLTGSLDVTLADRDGARITFNADFDFKAGVQSFDECAT